MASSLRNTPSLSLLPLAMVDGTLPLKKEGALIDLREKIYQLPFSNFNDNYLLKKYEGIIAQYLDGPDKNLILRKSREKCELTRATLLKVLGEADKFFNQPLAKQGGILIQVDRCEYIIKEDIVFDEQDVKAKTSKKHIIKLCNRNVLGIGGTAVVTKVLLVSEGRFVPLKLVKVRDETTGKLLSQMGVERNRGFIRNEYFILNQINKNNQCRYFQHKPVTMIDINLGSSLLPITGIVGDAIYNCDLFARIEKSVRKNFQLIDSIKMLKNKLNKLKEVNDKKKESVENYFNEMQLLKCKMNEISKLNSTAIEFCKQLMEAVSELYRRGFMHGDIKPDNIFVDLELNQEVLRLADFEGAYKLSNFFVTSQFEEGKATNGYHSPLDKIAIKKNFNNLDKKALCNAYRKADLFATGVTMFAILAEVPAYPVDSFGNIIPDSKPNIAFMEDREYPKEVALLVCSMLQLDPEKRISFEEAVKQWKAIVV